MKRTLLTGLVSLAVVAVASPAALAHCQIPCGIYDDPARFTLLEEHVTTIEKSMRQIESLSRQQDRNWNQIVRWVTNKEAHADRLSEIVTFYFMAQRVKPVDPGDKEAFSKYIRELTLLHQMLIHAMKSKQTVDVDHCAKLRELIADFKASYLGTPSPGHVHREASGKH